jgi:hypothetical protein
MRSYKSEGKKEYKESSPGARSYKNEGDKSIRKGKSNQKMEFELLAIIQIKKNMRSLGE